MDYHPQLDEKTEASKSEWTCPTHKTKKWDKNGFFWRMTTKHLVYCFLLPPIGVKGEEQDSLGRLKKGALLPAGGQGHQTPWQASLPPLASYILGMPNCFSLQMINRIQASEWWPAAAPDWLDDLCGLLFSAGCLIICPLNFRRSLGRWPETGRGLLSISCASSH